MAVSFTFQRKDKNSQITDKIVDDLISKVFYNKFFLGNPLVVTEKRNPSTLETEVIEVRIAQIMIEQSDKKSMNYMVNQIQNILRANPQFNILYLSGSSFEETSKSNGVNFKADFFSPEKTQNQILVEKLGLKDNEIPDEFKCSISYMVMDEPVYHILNKNVKYDAKTLRFCVDTTQSRTMPDTLILHEEKYMRTDSGLLARIANFIADKMAFKNEVNLRLILNTLKIPQSEFELNKQDALNKALRRAAMKGYAEMAIDLVDAGAQLNSQDTIPTKLMTPLHYALENNHFALAHDLLSLGAQPDIKNHAQLTALNKIEQIVDKEWKDVLLNTIRIIHPGIHEKHISSQRVTR